MATSGLEQILSSKPASADLSAHQFKLVVFDATPELALAGLTAGPAYILMDKPNAQGKNGTILLAGKGKVVIGAAIAAGEFLTPDAAGLAIPAAPAAGVNDEVCLEALEDGATSGDLISVFVNRFTLQGA